MPIRDHFRPPLAGRTKSGGFLGAWPALIVIDLNESLPTRYAAEPRVQTAASFDIDVAAPEDSTVEATVWAPPRPTFGVTTEPPGQDEYEVRVYDSELDRR